MKITIETSSVIGRRIIKDLRNDIKEIEIKVNSEVRNEDSSRASRVMKKRLPPDHKIKESLVYNS